MRQDDALARKLSESGLPAAAQGLVDGHDVGVDAGLGDAKGVFGGQQSAGY